MYTKWGHTLQEIGYPTPGQKVGNLVDRCFTDQTIVFIAGLGSGAAIFTVWQCIGYWWSKRRE